MQQTRVGSLPLANYTYILYSHVTWPRGTGIYGKGFDLIRRLAKPVSINAPTKRIRLLHWIRVRFRINSAAVMQECITSWTNEVCWQGYAYALKGVAELISEH